MLWILLSIFALATIISFVIDYEDAVVAFSIIGALFLVALVSCLGCYNSTKATVDKRIVVLEQRNNEVIAQIEPLVKQYLEYESNTFKDLKPSADKIIAIAQYPNLKGNEFVQTQIKTILENQEKITDLKLDKAGLNAYKIWIFMGE
jgi:hypothetical protein